MEDEAILRESACGTGGRRCGLCTRAGPNGREIEHFPREQHVPSWSRSTCRPASGL